MKKIYRPKNCGECPCYYVDSGDWWDTGYCGINGESISEDKSFWSESMKMPGCKVISITIEIEDD